MGMRPWAIPPGSDTVLESWSNCFGAGMKRFVEGEDRRQGVLLPEYLDDYVSEENPVRVIDVFVGELDLGRWGSRAWSRRRRAGRRITLARS